MWSVQQSELEMFCDKLRFMLMSLPFPLCNSLRYNYKVNDVFREIMGVSGMNGCSGTGIEFSQSSRHKSKCTIL
jgi:hypothetical protein